MNQQNPNDAKRPLTAEEIARLEAEAVAAAQRGEARPQKEGPEAAPSPDFVPYVDDAPKPEPSENRDAPDDEDEPYIPSKWEERIDALTPAQWKRWQILGGAAAGLVVMGSLFLFGQELATYGLIVAALVALLLPRYLERAWRRKLTVAKRAMLITMVIGLAVMFVVVGLRTGFTLTGGN